MEDWAIALLAAGIGAGIGGGLALLGVWLQTRLQQREIKEKYRIMTFPDRLAAHQKAFYWCLRLNEELNRRNTVEIREVARLTGDWWNEQCLYLDPNSRKLMVGLVNLSHDYARWLDTASEDRPLEMTQMVQKIWPVLHDTTKAIVEGIGAEYLPEMQRDEEKTEK